MYLCISFQMLLLIVLRCGLELILQSIFFSNSKSVPSLERCCKWNVFICMVWKAAAGAERSRQLYFSKELEFSGKIQAVYLHKNIWTNPHFFPIWHLGCNHFLCHSGRLPSAYHSLWPGGQLSWGRGASCLSPLQEKFSLLAVCVFKISCWERGPQHTQIKGIPNNKASADIFLQAGKVSMFVLSN